MLNKLERGTRRETEKKWLYLTGFDHFKSEILAELQKV